MKFIITICLFAFAATVAAKIPIVDMADWVCVSEQLNVAADRNPKFAALYSELGQFYQASVTGAEKCNQIDEWVLELFCQCEWKTQVEDLSQMFSDLLREKVSSVEMPISRRVFNQLLSCS